MSTTPLANAINHFEKYSEMRKGCLIGQASPLSPLAEHHLASAVAYILDHLKSVERDERSPREDEGEPEPKVLVIGISKGASLQPAVKTFTSWKDVCDAYGWIYSAERQAEDERRDRVPMMHVVPVGSGDAASRLPCPCSRCGKEATLLHAFENSAGTEVYCGYECYRAAGGDGQ